MASSDGDIFVPDFPDFDISDILLDLELPTCSTTATVPSTTATVVTEDGNCSKRGNKRNIRAISDIELAKRNEARIPEGTKWSTSWCVRTWIEWAEERTETNTTSTSDLYYIYIYLLNRLIMNSPGYMCLTRVNAYSPMNS